MSNLADEAEALRHMAKAAQIIDLARSCTNQGLADDYCVNAQVQLHDAMRMIVDHLNEILGREDAGDCEAE